MQLHVGHSGCYRRYLYTRLTSSDGRTYLQIVESFRNDTGKVRHPNADNAQPRQVAVTVQPNRVQRSTDRFSVVDVGTLLGEQ